MLESNGPQQLYVSSGVSDLTFASRVRGQVSSECQIHSTPLGAGNRVVTVQEIGVSLNRKRAPYQEALHFVASLFDQDFHLVVGFNTFGQRGQSEPVRETDDGAHNRKRPLCAAQ